MEDKGSATVETTTCIADGVGLRRMGAARLKDIDAACSTQQN